MSSLPDVRPDSSGELGGSWSNSAQNHTFRAPGAGGQGHGHGANRDRSPGQEPHPSPQGRGAGRPCSLPGAGGGGASLGSPQLLSTTCRDGFSRPSLHLGTQKAMLEAPGPLLASLHPARELGAQVPQVAGDCPLHPFPPGLVVLEPAQTDESVTRGPKAKGKTKGATRQRSIRIRTSACGLAGPQAASSGQAPRAPQGKPEAMSVTRRHPWV